MGVLKQGVILVVKQYFGASAVEVGRREQRDREASQIMHVPAALSHTGDTGAQTPRFSSPGCILFSWV